MTEPNSPNYQLTGKRVIVCGDDPLRHAVYSSLKLILGCERINLADDEEHAREYLWMAGDSSDLYDSTHLVFVSTTLLTPEKVFRTHCRCRPNDRHNATLSNLGPGWSGGIIFLGPTGGDLKGLLELEPFHRIRAGHAVLPLRTLLLELLYGIARLAPIYPEKWGSALLSLKELSSLKLVLGRLRGKSALSASELHALLNSLNTLLANDLLGRLLAHREVIGKLREVVHAINEAQSVDLNQFPATFVNDAERILADYL